MSANSYGVHLIRGYKVRLLRAPARLPWKTGDLPLEGSPRFVPFLLEALPQNHSFSAPVELRAYPGDPLGQEREITYLDGAILAAAALFSFLISPTGHLLVNAYDYLLNSLNNSLEPALKSGEQNERPLRFLIKLANASKGARETLGLFVRDESNKPVNGLDKPLDEAPWEELSALQEELIKALSFFKQHGNAKTESRKRELVAAFRAGKLKVSPSVEGQDKLPQRVRDYINHILAQEACKRYRPLKRGYAKTHGGLINKTPKPGSPDVMLFSPCKTAEGVSLFYSDLSVRIERYRKLSSPDFSAHDQRTRKCASLLARADALLSVVGRGDFIQIPLLWWGAEGRGHLTYQLFFRHLVDRSQALRFLLLSLSGLLAKNIKDLLAAYEFSKCPSLGHARLLLEAELTYLHHATPKTSLEYGKKGSSNYPSIGIMKLALRHLRKDIEKNTWERFIEFAAKYRWGSVWGLPETILFASRAPLPVRSIETRRSSRSGRVPSSSEKLRPALKDVLNALQSEGFKFRREGK